MLLGARYSVRGLKSDDGWHLTVDGIGTTRSDTLAGAAMAARALLRDRLGPRAADEAELDLTPKAGATDLGSAIQFARAIDRSVLVTVRREGRPQLSNVSHLVRGQTIVVPTAHGRAKVHNLRRDDRVSLYLSPDPYSYLVIDGAAVVSSPAESADDPLLDIFVDLHRRRHGEVADWDEFRRARVAERRLIVTIFPVYAYGMTAE